MTEVHSNVGDLTDMTTGMTTDMTEANADVGTLAYAQWAIITVHNNFRASDAPSLELRNATLKWGKFHAEGNKDNEVKSNQISGMVIEKGNNGKIHTCGRSDSASGTEGSVDIFVRGTGTKVCRLYWNCPWGSKSNSFQVNDQNNDYPVAQEGANSNSGALGNVTIKVTRAG